MSRSLPAALLLLAACAPPPPPAIGGRCAGNGSGTCDETATEMLVCTGGRYALYSDCRGPDRCTVQGDTVSCDTRGNGAGDTCPPESEGKVRCEPDGGPSILRCVDGGLVAVERCPPQTRCSYVPDAGLSCW